MIVKILRNIIAYVTVAIAIGYTIYITFFDQCNTYEYMILSLLILIATTFVLEMLDDKRKWKEVEENLKRDISAITNCKILVYDNTKDWVDKIQELTKEGTHSFDSAALDKTTRSKAKTQYSSIWGYLNTCSREDRIQFRHILRIRKNNLKNLLERIIAGSAQKNSYFAYYELPSNFSFPTFGVIDKQYVVTRSPYQQGEEPCYMIIDNQLITNYFIKYFEDLWRESNKIENISVLNALFAKFENEYSEKEKRDLEGKIHIIAKDGIMDDI